MFRVPRGIDVCTVCVPTGYQNKQLQKKSKQHRGIPLPELKGRLGNEKSKQFGKKKVCLAKERGIAK